jgi:hypothetical protein
MIQVAVVCKPKYWPSMSCTFIFNRYLSINWKEGKNVIIEWKEQHYKWIHKWYSIISLTLTI